MGGCDVARLDLGREIVASTLSDGQPALDKYLSQGWDRDWVSDQTNILRLAVFREPHNEAWRFILKHYDKHSRVPSEDMLPVQRTHPLP